MPVLLRMSTAPDEQGSPPVIATEIRQVLAELEMVSQVSAAATGSSSRDESESIGGRRPPGGIIRKDDRQDTFPQKSVDHFRRRLAHARTDRHLQAILEDAQTALVAWKRQPPEQPGDEPQYGTPGWKRWVGECDLSHGEIARKYNLSRAYVRKIRDQYREAA